MKTRVACRVLLAIATCVVVMSIAACASIEGGIVGTGNRIDCEKKEGVSGPIPQECEQQAR